MLVVWTEKDRSEHFPCPSGSNARPSSMHRKPWKAIQPRSHPGSRPMSPNKNGFASLCLAKQTLFKFYTVLTRSTIIITLIVKIVLLFSAHIHTPKARIPRQPLSHTNTLTALSQSNKPTFKQSYTLGSMQISPNMQHLELYTQAVPSFTIVNLDNYSPPPPSERSPQPASNFLQDPT